MKTVFTANNNNGEATAKLSQGEALKAEANDKKISPNGVI